MEFSKNQIRSWVFHVTEIETKGHFISRWVFLMCLSWGHCSAEDGLVL